MLHQDHEYPHCSKDSSHRGMRGLASSLALLWSLTFFASHGFAEELDGYKDLKFGMTIEQAKATKVFKEGVILFKKQREVIFVVNEASKVSAIIVKLTELTDKEARTQSTTTNAPLQDEVLPILKTKYKLAFEPRDVDYAAYKTFLDGKGTSPAGKKLLWVFADGQLSFVRNYYTNKEKGTEQENTYLFYQDQSGAKTLMAVITAERQAEIDAKNAEIERQKKQAELERQKKQAELDRINAELERQKALNKKTTAEDF